MNLFEALIAPPDFSRVNDGRLVQPDQLQEAANWIAGTPELFVDFEATGLLPRKGAVPISCGLFAPDKGAKDIDFRFTGDAGRAAVRDGLTARKQHQTTAAFNLGMEHRMTKALGGKLNGRKADPMCYAYALKETGRPPPPKADWERKGSGGLSQKALVWWELGIEPVFSKAVKSWLTTNFGHARGNYERLPAELIVPYQLEDAEQGYALFKHLEKQVKSNFMEPLVQTDSDLACVIADLEDRGIRFDVDYAKRLVDKYSGELKDAYRSLKLYVGRDVDVNQHSKLFGLVYGELKLPMHGDISKSGKLDHDVFEWMLHLPHIAEWDKDGELVRVVDAKLYHTLVAILDIRECTKMLDTYLRPWLYEWAEKGPDGDWVIHANLNYIGPITRRFSASDPNMQNVPTRTDRGGELRKCFISRRGYKAYSMDESQAEYRAFAHYSKDPKLCNAYRNDRLTDIHQVVSEILMKLDRSMVRKKAKHTNFGILYGMGTEKLSRKLGCSKEQAKGILDYYLKMIPGVATLREECRAEVRGKGYISDIFGGRVHLTPDESYKALNNRMQMTVANLMRKAMVVAAPILESAGGATLLQVHDELLFELPGEDSREHLPTLRRVRDEAMQNFPQFSVPIYSDCEVWSSSTQVDDNWAEAVPMEGM